MTLTRRPLLPIVSIKKNDDATFYNFDPFNGVYDFRMQYLECSPAFDNTGGHFEAVIVGATGANSEANTILSNISEGNEILISVGKTYATASAVIRGIIETIEINEPNKNLMTINLSGLDWGSDLLMGRIVSLYLEQDRAADGKTPLSTDLKTKLNNIVLTLLGTDYTDSSSTTTAYPAAQDSQRITAAQQGVIVSSANIVDTGLSVPNFNVSFRKLQDALNDIDNMNNTVHWIDANKNFYMQKEYSVPPGASNILLTDDASDALIATYPNYGLIYPGSTYKKTIEAHRRRLFGLDQSMGQADSVASKETNTGTVNVDNSYIALKFTPNYRNCSAIALYCQKVGTPPDSLQVELREDNNTTPNGSLIAAAEKVADRISTTIGWHYFPVGASLNKAVAHWIVCRPPNQSSDTSNCYKWGKDSAVNATNASSTDGTTWVVNSANSYNLNFRVDYTDEIVHIWPAIGVTSSSKHLWEEVISKPSLTNENTMAMYIQGQLPTYQARKEIVSLKVYAPDVLIIPGQLVHVHKAQSGYLVNADFYVAGIKYVFDSGDDLATGTFYIEVTASRFTTYT